MSCSVTQLFAKIILDIPHALLLPEEQNKSDNNTETPIETKLNVYFSEDAIILKNTDGNIAIEVGKTLHLKNSLFLLSAS